MAPLFPSLIIVPSQSAEMGVGADRIDRIETELAPHSISARSHDAGTSSSKVK
jgi:hypothetical protein